ncbi:MAG: hypothetical protein ACRDHG_15725 [Anaerolineales bacterium]
MTDDLVTIEKLWEKIDRVEQRLVTEIRAVGVVSQGNAVELAALSATVEANATAVGVLATSSGLRMDRFEGDLKSLKVWDRVAAIVYAAVAAGLAWLRGSG